MEEAEIPEVGVDAAADAAHEHTKGEHGRTPWLKRLALTTAILAVFAAVASLQSGRFSNEAILEQARATDQWSFFQGKGNKLVTRTAEMEMSCFNSRRRPTKSEVLRAEDREVR